MRIKAVVSALKKSDNILILTHLRPDGDTLGSAYALKGMLEGMGKNVCVACDSKITPKYQYITGSEIIQPLFEPEFIVAVDIANPSLLGGSLEKYADKVDMVLDHHPSNNGFGRINVIEPDFASSGELIYDIVLESKVKMTQNIMDNLYIAIATDTGCFRYSNTTAKSLEKAAKLVAMGAAHLDINRRFFELKTPQQITLQKMVMDTLRFYSGGKIAIIVVSLDIIKKAEALEDDIEGLSAFPRRINGVDVGLTIREIIEGEYKISARSNEGVNVSEICQHFGGGGHVRAAGCTIKGEVKEIKKQLVDKINEVYKGQKS